MHWIQAIVLGAVQGLTEFLPISSSAHLDIVPVLLGWPKPGAAFTAVIQLGTLLAVLVFFAKDIFATLGGAWLAWRRGERQAPAVRLLVAVVVGTIPIGVCGLVFKKWIEGPLHNLWINAAMLVVMAVALAAAEKWAKPSRPLEQVSLRDGLVVGFAQALALIPGASRSGSTLTGAFLTGLDRAAAVRFSFLLSLPAVLLSGLLELRELGKPVEPGQSVAWAPGEIALATVVAGVVGYACIAWLLKYLARRSTLVFVVYRLMLGIFLAGMLASGRIAP
jgi:undecaprenyl-diphosphatase